MMSIIQPSIGLWLNKKNNNNLFFDFFTVLIFKIMSETTNICTIQIKDIIQSFNPALRHLERSQKVICIFLY